jgi:hypothetical protein
LALLVGGGFLIGWSNRSVKAIDAVYRQVFSDNFNRDNTSGTSIGNGWSFPGGYNCSAPKPNPTYGVDNWKIESGILKGGAGYCDDRTNGGSQYAWKASPILQTAYSIFDGKATFDYDASISPNNTVVGVVARFDSTTGAGAFFGFYETPDRTVNQLYRRVLPDGAWGDPNINNVSNMSTTTDTLTGQILPNHVRVELILSGNNFTFNVYDLDGNLDTPLYVVNGNNNNLGSLTGRAWGLQSFNANGPADNFTLYEVDNEFAANADKEGIKLGDSITYTFADDESRTLSNFSDGAGGSFNPTIVELNSGNNYAATVVYTPITLGQHTVSASVTGDETFESSIFVSPYSTKIGLLGDSITNNMSTTYVASALGSGFSVANAGVCGARAGDYAQNLIDHDVCGGLTAQGGAVMTDTLNLFNNNGIEIVHMMIGTNDLSHSNPEQYKTNMQTIIDTLRSNAITGTNVKHVVLSKLIWRADQSSVAKIPAFDTVIDELVVENGDFVLAGDSDAYAWFENDNKTNMTDGLHPNTGVGRQTLAEFWAEAIKTNLEYQINPDKTWVDLDSEFQLGEGGTLMLNIDKYFGEFESVSVDGSALTAGYDYTATASSTVIEFSNAYLNVLAVGSHTLIASFYGGVNVTSNFNILAAGNSDGNNNTGDSVGNNTPGVPNTGVFGLSWGDITSLFSAVALATLAGMIILSRKLFKRANDGKTI